MHASIVQVSRWKKMLEKHVLCICHKRVATKEAGIIIKIKKRYKQWQTISELSARILSFQDEWDLFEGKQEWMN